MQSAVKREHQAGDLEIEFIGGPYDGYREFCFTRPTHLPEDVVWFVCEDVFHRLDGQWRDAKQYRSSGSLTSAALYELEGKNGAHRYRFVGAISVRELSLCMR